MLKLNTFANKFRFLENQLKFKEELQALLNKYSMESGSDTPDFILAEYLYNCLDAFNLATNQRSTLCKPMDSIFNPLDCVNAKFNEDKQTLQALLGREVTNEEVRNSTFSATNTRFGSQENDKMIKQSEEERKNVENWIGTKLTDEQWFEYKILRKKTYLGHAYNIKK